VGAVCSPSASTASLASEISYLVKEWVLVCSAPAAAAAHYLPRQLPVFGHAAMDPMNVLNVRARDVDWRADPGPP